MSKAKNASRRSRQKGQRRRGPSIPALLVLGGILVLAIGLLAAWWNRQADEGAGEEAGAPRLVVDQERVDLGDVPLDQSVSVSFRLSNAGEGTLRFREAPFIEVVEGC